MDNSNIQWNRNRPIAPIDNNKTSNNTIKKKSTPFEDILNEKIKDKQSLKISKHANQRIQLRNINMTSEVMEKLNEATNKAEEKGVNDSLVILNDKAFIVNIKSKTVVTAFDEKGLKDNIFTNIDGAVVL